MTNSERFIEAHKTAKQTRGCFSTYRDAFTFALMEIYAMQNALRKALADLGTVDDRIEMKFIIGQFYAGYADKDEVARGIIVQLRLHRAAQHRHYWALAANKELWKPSLT